MSTDATDLHLSCQSRGLFRRYSAYLRNRHGGKAYRVAVDAGFSCPNRGADRSGGCSYCDAFGSRAAYTRSSVEASIADQVETGVAFLRKRYGAERFLLYLQAFSNTFGPVSRLERIYDFALSLHEFRELIVATRPDCVDAPVAGLLASYRSEDRDVWVELGLQSACDETLLRIGRGHTVVEFERAYRLLRGVDVKIAVHLILGLPGEDWSEIKRTVAYVASLGPDAVKFHDLHVASDTRLAKEYLRGELVVPSQRRYLDYLSRSIELLPPETIVMRLSCDTPRERRLAPLRPLPKQELIRELEKLLIRRGGRQGSRYAPAATDEAIE